MFVCFGVNSSRVEVSKSFRIFFCDGTNQGGCTVHNICNCLIPCGAYWQETANTSPVPLLRKKESKKKKQRNNKYLIIKIIIITDYKNPKNLFFFFFCKSWQNFLAIVNKSHLENSLPGLEFWGEFLFCWGENFGLVVVVVVVVVVFFFFCLGVLCFVLSFFKVLGSFFFF